MKLLKLIADLSIGRLFILGAITTGTYFYSYFDDGSSIEAQITTVQAEITNENARRVEIEKTMKKEEEMRGNLLQLERNLEVVKSKIPNEFSGSEMSLIINSAASASHMAVMELNAKELNENSKPVVGDKNAIRPEDLISEIVFSIRLSGRYDDFLMFLDTLTKEDKVIKLRNLSIERSSQEIDDNTIKLAADVIGYKQSGIGGTK